MKRILYYIVLLLAATFTACHEDQLTGPDVSGVSLNFTSASPEVSNQVMTETINSLNLFIFDEKGIFVKQETYNDLQSVTPVKLALGKYTFAYLSNVNAQQIGGIKQGAKLQDLTISHDEIDRKVIPIGSLFSGKDEITVGEQKASNAALKRIVGCMLVNVKGISAGVSLKSISLLGSPKTVRFTGEAVGKSVKLDIPILKEKDTLVGQAIAFPTIDGVATLEFVIATKEGEKTHTIALKNKIEANKVHTINAQINTLGTPGDITITLETVSPWGESNTENITATKTNTVDTLTLKIFMEQGSSVDLKRVKTVDLHLENKTFHDSYNLNAQNEQIYFSGDTLVFKVEDAYRKFICGLYSLEYIYLRDDPYYDLYRMVKPIVVSIDTSGITYIMLPKPQTVVESDRLAMLDLREAMSNTGYYNVKQWNAVGDEIGLWDDVQLNAEGRVIGIDNSMSGDGEDTNLNKKATNQTKTTRSRSTKTTTWSLPESFKNLTALKYFNPEVNNLDKIPSFIKDMTNLEEVTFFTTDGNIPELPASLKYLYIKALNAKIIPVHVGSLSKLIEVTFNIDYDSDAFPLPTKSNLSSIEADFSRISTLKSLAIEAGPQCPIPASLWNCSSIQDLTLLGFSNIQIPASINMTALTELGIANMEVTAANLEDIKNLKLKFLGLIAPQFGKNGLPDWLGTMSSLADLSLDSCNITTLPNSLDGLKNLVYLDIENNGALTGKLPTELLQRYSNMELNVSYDSPSFSPDGIILSVNKQKIEIPAAGGTSRLTIKSNSPWTINMTDYYSFIQLSSLSGTGDAIIEITAKKNSDSWEKRENIIISAGNRHSIHIDLYQAPGMELPVDSNGTRSKANSALRRK